MNLIGLIFSILALLAFSASIALEKQMTARRLHSTYTGHLTATRQILSAYESEVYASLKSPPKETEKSENPKKESDYSLIPPPLVNPSCARLNLFPLLEKDREEEKILYETAAKFLKVFYGASLFEKKPRAEYEFLTSLLEALREQQAKKTTVSLEKIALNNPDLKRIYYKMLKGTKKHDLLKGIGYPSFLDYFKLEPTSSKICISHAHPNLLAIFFTAKGASHLYAAIHKTNAPFPTKEIVERLCQEVHVPLFETNWSDLFEFSFHHHPKEIQTTFLGEDPETEILVKKVISLRKL